MEVLEIGLMLPGLFGLNAYPLVSIEIVASMADLIYLNALSRDHIHPKRDHMVQAVFLPSDMVAASPGGGITTTRHIASL